MAPSLAEDDEPVAAATTTIAIPDTGAATTTDVTLRSSADYFNVGSVGSRDDVCFSLSKRRQSSGCTQLEFDLQCERHVFTSFQTAINMLMKVFSPAQGPLEHKRVTSILDSLNFNVKEWKQYAKYVQGNYKRQLVARTPTFAIFLKVWKAGQESLVHDHNGCESWIKVLEGELQETLYETSSFSLKPKLDRTLTPSKVTYLESDCIHQNRADSPCATLHFYSPPYSGNRNYEIEEITWKPNANINSCCDNKANASE